MDLPPLIKRFERIVNPSLLVVMERELWPSLLSVTRTKKVLVNTYARGNFLEKILIKKFDLVLTRTEQDALKLGQYTRALSCGNLKFVLEEPPAIDFRRPEGKLIVAGSTHPEEDITIIRVYQKLKETFKDLKLILVPRHVHRAYELKRLYPQFRLRSEDPQNWDVLIVDTLGELFRMYSFADICFVGGTLVKVGGHNLLEPIYWNKPVVFGPYYFKVQDLAEFILRKGYGRVASNETELYKTFSTLLKQGVSLDTNMKELSEQIKRCYLEQIKGLLLSSSSY